MSSEIKESCLGEIVASGEAALQTGPFGTMLKASEYSKSGAPVISVGEIREGFLAVESKTPRVSEEVISRLPRFLLEENDIVFGRKGSTHRNALIKKEEEGYFLGSDGIRLRVNSNALCPKFISYQLRSKKAENWLKMNSEGTTMPSLNQDILSRFPITILPTGDQKAIAHILGTLDQKIELNRKTNETLEGIAKALFKSWFVDFDPVRAKAEGRPTGLPDEISGLFPDSFEESELGEIPSGWSVAEIGDFLDLERDSVTPSDSGEEIFDHYSIPAYDEGLMPSLEAGQSIKSNKYLVTDGVFMVSKLNPRFPRIWVPSKHATRRRICSTEFLVCRPKVKTDTPFVLHVTKSRSVVQQMSDLASGTSNSHQRVRPADFIGLPFVRPSAALVKLFSEMIGPMLEKHLLTRDENQALSKSRDTLLPRLISGELRVPDAEKILEEVGI